MIVLYLIQCHHLMTGFSDDEMNGSGNSDSDFETVKPSEAVGTELYLYRSDISTMYSFKTGFGAKLVFAHKCC